VFVVSVVSCFHHKGHKQTVFIAFRVLAQGTYSYLALAQSMRSGIISTSRQDKKVSPKPTKKCLAGAQLRIARLQAPLRGNDEVIIHSPQYF